MILGFFIGIILLSVLGFVLGFGLAWLARVLHVEVDPKQDKVLEILPGANCGGCGYPGCSGYAEAIVKKGVDINLCTVCTPEKIAAIGKVMGKTSDVTKERFVAKIKCSAVHSEAKKEYKFNGEDDCFAVFTMFRGDKACKYGCMGYGNCSKVCPVQAIKRDELGRLYVDSNVCIGCKKCTTVCPTGVIQMVPLNGGYFIACNSKENAKVVKEVCGRGCYGCKACERATGDTNRICVENFLAQIKYDSKVDLSGAATKCPAHVIVPIVTPKK